MSQLNTANQSNPNFYSLGRGKLYFSALTNSLPSGGWRDLGNCPSFNINSEEETIEHKSSQSGLATTDKKLTISRTTNVSFDLDELSFDNLADWFSGDAEADVSTLTIETAYTDEVILGTGAWTGGAGFTTYTLDKWYEMYDDSGKRLYFLPSGYIIEDGAVTAVEGADYEIDAKAGLIMIKSGGMFAANDPVTLTADFSGTNVDIDEVRAFSQGSVTGALKFVAINPANSDDVREFQFHQVTLASDGDLSLIGDEFSTMSFTGVIEKNEVADADSPYVTIRGQG